MDNPGMDNRIEQRRLALGWTQEQLATRAITSTQQISRLERGERKLSQEWLLRLSKALQCTPSDLLAENDRRYVATPSDSGDDQEVEEMALLILWRRLPTDVKVAIVTLAKAAAPQSLDAV